MAFHFPVGARDGVACVEVLIPGQRCISVSYRINAEGVVAGLTTDGATQLLLHVKGKTSVQDFSAHLATLVECAFTAGDLMLTRAATALRSEAAPASVAHTQNVYAGMIPG
ncbi:MAG: hypothetical protein EKK49_15645 [Rhodocyclaceae bacterium]|nr:MAG: hypothetical protein EKK49_15645 [Rhodocyclaceae bacterium]